MRGLWSPPPVAGILAAVLVATSPVAAGGSAAGTRAFDHVHALACSTRPSGRLAPGFTERPTEA